MKIILACDHGAIDIKRQISNHLQSRGIEVEDIGVYTTDSIDYPDMAEKACQLFLKGGYDGGILFCGTGIGISIAANKIKSIRCALVHNTFTAQMAAEHNNAQFIALGGRINYAEKPETIVDAWLDHKFAGGRHLERVNKMMALEDKN